jgi:quercetin dioxygenase-like cupin family protein
MKLKLDTIKGEIVKDNETYILEDNNYLEHLVLSRTNLHPGQSTRGHSHETQEEVYIFTTGEAFMQIGDNFHHAKSGDIFLIKAGEFHRVLNKSEMQPCTFTCVFEKYDRSGDEAKYKNI